MSDASVLHLRLPADVAERVTQLSADERRSRSNMVVRLIDETLQGRAADQREEDRWATRK